MSDLSIKERLQKIIERCEFYGITAYQIGSATSLNTSGVQRILDGKVEKPRNATLRIIEDYIGGHIVQTREREARESELIYNSPTELEKAQQKIIDLQNDKIHTLEEKLKKCQEELFFKDGKVQR